MSQHGRRRAASAPVVEDAPGPRFGFLTMESALVLGLVALIAVGSVLVQFAFPADRETETVIGDKKVRITTVGKGGVQPGPVRPRVVPVVAPTPVPAVAPAPSPTVKPRKPKRAATTAPKPTPSPTTGSGGGDIPGPGGGGGTGGGGGGGGGGKDECTVLIFCQPGQKPAPAPTPQPAATEPPGQQQPPSEP